MKLGISLLINMAPPQKLVLAPSAMFRGNTVYEVLYVISQYHLLCKICRVAKSCETVVLIRCVYFIKVQTMRTLPSNWEKRNTRHRLKRDATIQNGMKNAICEFELE